MNSKINFYFLFILITLASCASTPKSAQICPKIFIHSDEEIELSDTERRLICGDQDEKAYTLIPSYQASYLLTGFFQSRGYSQPRFEYEGDVLHAYPDDKSRLKHVVVISENESDSQLIVDEIMQKYKKDIITPKLLDEIEATSIRILRDNSYPCAKVLSQVDASKETVTITLIGLVPFQYGVIKKEHIEGVDDRALERFYPFISDDYFSGQKLTLAEKRFLRSGIVQGTYFQENCQLGDKKFTLTQQFIPGNAKTIRFGAGASTELGLMARTKWSNQRSGDMASLLEASLQVSFKNQYFNFISDRYLWKDAPRRSLLTSFEIERDDQDTFEELTATLKPHIQWTHDTSSRLWIWSTGPTLIAGSYKTEVVAEKKEVRTGALEGKVETKSHEYEVFDIHPEAGDYGLFHFDFRHPSLGFTDPLLKLDLTYLRLIALGDLGKGEAIGGIKLTTGTTWVPDNVPLADLPPSVKFYGGGSDDIRGFKLTTLPENNGNGALTKVSLKFEFRKTYVFKPTIESFTFLDTVYFGYRPWELESRLWYSPGTGLRWLSPIGLVQGYIARALSNKETKDNGNYFFLGLGGVF
jgi:translocation and assembly module TamA